MAAHPHPQVEARGGDRHQHFDSQRQGFWRHHPSEDRRRGFWRRWLVANSLVSGAFALGWLVLRSGTKPSRFAYPCQQAALSTATLAFGGPLVATLIAARRRVVAGLRTRAGVVLAAVGLFAATGIWGYLSYANAYRGSRGRGRTRHPEYGLL